MKHHSITNFIEYVCLVCLGEEKKRIGKISPAKLPGLENFGNNLPHPRPRRVVKGDGSLIPDSGKPKPEVLLHRIIIMRSVNKQQINRVVYKGPGFR